jgi:uroporphyrinogen decarboxylase
VDKRADAPVLPTVFSPLSLARKLSGDRLTQDLRERPEAVVAALEAIMDTLLRFINLCLDEGAGGIFYSIQAASHRFHTQEEYARFGEPYDRRILEAAMARANLVIVHCHGDELMFDRLAHLPGHAWNWDDRATGPSLREGKARVNGAVIGGVNQWRTVCEGTAEEVRAEVNEAVAQTDGIGLIIGPGCVLPPAAPDQNVAALVRALGGKLGLVL